MSKTNETMLMKTAAERIEDVIDLLDLVIRNRLLPVDRVLAARVEVARDILEHVDNDIHDTYDVGRWFE